MPKAEPRSIGLVRLITMALADGKMPEKPSPTQNCKIANGTKELGINWHAIKIPAAESAITKVL